MRKSQPVSEANADSAYSLHATNPGCQFRTEEAGVRRLVRDAPHGGQSKIDRGRCVIALFEVDPVPEHDSAVEREAGLRTVPGDELANRVGRRFAGRWQTSGCSVLRSWRVQIREGQNPLGRPLLARFRLGHRQRPPLPLSTASSTGTSCGVYRDLQLLPRSGHRFHYEVQGLPGRAYR
jgi:hypothetical protein